MSNGGMVCNCHMFWVRAVVVCDKMVSDFGSSAMMVW